MTDNTQPHVSFNDYQKFTSSTAVYPGSGTGSYEAITYCALKGGGECGEFLEKLGKHMRKQGSITALNRAALGDDLRLALAKELGDRLWYISQGAAELGYTLSEIASINVDKLSDRKERNVLIGEGDDR
jgi:NTP pyrophosphatase (non-canonical NTP hydrolase)